MNYSLTQQRVKVEKKRRLFPTKHLCFMNHILVQCKKKVIDQKFNIKGIFLNSIHQNTTKFICQRDQSRVLFLLEKKLSCILEPKQIFIRDCFHLLKIKSSLHNITRFSVFTILLKQSYKTFLVFLCSLHSIHLSFTTRGCVRRCGGLKI